MKQSAESLWSRSSPTRAVRTRGDRPPATAISTSTSSSGGADSGSCGGTLSCAVPVPVARSSAPLLAEQCAEGAEAAPSCAAAGPTGRERRRTRSRRACVAGGGTAHQPRHLASTLSRSPSGGGGGGGGASGSGSGRGSGRRRRLRRGRGGAERVCACYGGRTAAAAQMRAAAVARAEWEQRPWRGWEDAEGAPGSPEAALASVRRRGRVEVRTVRRSTRQSFPLGVLVLIGSRFYSSSSSSTGTRGVCCTRCTFSGTSGSGSSDLFKDFSK